MRLIYFKNRRQKAAGPVGEISSLRATTGLFSTPLLAILITLLTTAWTNPSSANSIPAQAVFKPSAITLGQAATYTVNIPREIEDVRFTPPEVSGLNLIPSGSGRSFSTRIENGRRVSSTTVMINFQANVTKTGTFTVPGYNLNVKGELFVISPATLKVLPADTGESEAMSLDEIVFLEFSTVQEPIYSGQLIDGHLKIFVLSQMQDPRYGEVTKSGDAFSEAVFSENIEKTMLRRNGHNYTLIALPLTLTPLKAGLQELRFELPVQIAIPRQSNQRRSNQGFGNGLFDDFFNRSFADRRTFQLSTGDLKMDVLPLPEKDKPESFSGAVGSFTLDHQVSSRHATVGEPLTYTITLHGQGNFDRIAAPVLSIDKQWKTYNPKIEFEASEQSGGKGIKTFEYIIIPGSDDITGTPSFSFSYFNPEKSDYFDLRKDPITIAVSPAPEGTEPYIPQGYASQDDTGSSERSDSNKKPNSSLLFIELLPGTWYSAIVPTFLSRIFLVSQGIPFFLIVVVWMIRKRQLRFRYDDAFVRKVHATRSVRLWLRKVDKAVEESDTGKFFEAAHRTIQESVGKHFEGSAQTLTLSEIDAFVTKRTEDSAIIEGIEEFFRETDAIKFAGSVRVNFDLKVWRTKLQSLIEKLEGIR